MLPNDCEIRHDEEDDDDDKGRRENTWDDIAIEQFVEQMQQLMVPQTQSANLGGVRSPAAQN